MTKKTHSTFIFDCGRVLIYYDSRVIVESFFPTDEIPYETIEPLLYNDWHLLDEGMPALDYYEKIKDRFSEKYQPCLKNLLLHWPEAVTNMPGAEEFVRRLHEKRKKLILLSNMPDIFIHYLGKYPSLSYFDDLLFSYQEGMVKPNPEFFKYALKKNHVQAEDCLFIDDLQSNIDAAASLGIDTFLFDFKHPAESIEKILEAEGLDK